MKIKRITQDERVVIFLRVSDAEYVPKDLKMYYRNAVTVFSLFREGPALCLNTEGWSKKQMPSFESEIMFKMKGVMLRIS